MTPMRALVAAGVLLLLSLPVLAEERPPARAEIPRIPHHVTIDGDPSEWMEETVPIVIDQPWQSVELKGPGRTWDGPDDLSGRIYVAVTDRALLLGGVIRDDHLYFHAPRPWEGDAVEVFLDTSPSGSKAEYDENCYQIVLAPLLARNRWTFAKVGPRLVITDHGLDGVVVEGQEIREDGEVTGYTFEARIPLVNLPEFQVAPRREVGFNVALVDAEPGPGQKAYLTWNGKPRLTDNPQRFGRLRFLDALQSEPTSTTSPGPAAWRPLVIVALAGVLIALVFLFRRALLRIVRLPLRVKLVAAAAFATVYIVALVAPRLVDRAQRADQVAALREQAKVFEEIAEEAARFGILRSGGFDEDRRALLLLLGGGTVPIPVERDMTPLWAREPDRDRKTIDEPPIPYLEYEVHVRTGMPEVLPVADRVRGRTVALIVSYTLWDWTRTQPPSGRPVARLEALFANGTTVERELLYDRDVVDAVLPDAETEPAVESPEIRVAWRRPLDDGRVHHAVVVPLEVPRGSWDSALERLEVRSLGADGDLVLHGVTVLDEDVSHTLSLGGRSPAGIPYRVRNAHPPGATRSLRREEAPLVLPVPGPREAVDRVWLLVALSGGYDRLRHEQPVARVRLLDAQGGTPIPEFELQTGKHLGPPTMYEPELPPGMASRPGFRWGTRHLDEIEIPIDPPAEIAAIEIEHAGGPETLIVAGVTLGAPRPRPTPAESRHLVETEPGSVRLRNPEVLSDDLAGFAVMSGGRVAEARSPDSAATQRLRGSALAAETIHALAQGESRIETRILAGRDALLLWVPSPIAGDAVGAWTPVRTDAFARQAGVLIGFAALGIAIPLALLAAIDLLGQLRRLRLKLLLALGLASIVPLLLLFFLVQETLVTPVEVRRKEGLLRRASELGSRLSNLVDEASAAVKESSRDELLRAALERLARTDEIAEAATVREIESRLAVLAGEVGILPDWEGALSVRVDVEGSGRGAHLLPRDSEEPMLLGWTPARSDVVREWSRFGVKAVSHEAGSPVRWTMVLDLPGDDAFVQGLKSRLGGRLEVQLYSPRGFPLAGTMDQEPEGSRAEIRAKAGIVDEVLRTNAPVAREVDASGGRFLVAYDVLKDRKGDVVALVGVASPQAEVLAAKAQLRDLFIGLVVVALLLELLIGTLLTRRITRPILELERVVREVRRGNLDVRAPSIDLRDEVGALTRAVNHMTEELSVRLGELRRLNEGIRRLTTHLERQEVVEAGLALLREAAEPDACALVLADRTRSELELIGMRPASLPVDLGKFPLGPGLLRSALESREPVSIPDASAASRRRSGTEAALLRGFRGVVILPLSLGEEVIGAALLLDREPREATPDNLPFLTALAGQLAAALENARLYRLAIEDGRTGLYVHSYFMARLGEEVDRSLGGDRPLSLLVGALDHYDTLEDRYGPEEVHRVFQEVIRRVRESVRRMYVMGRTGRDGLEILLPEADKRAAMAVAVRVRQAVSASPIPLGGEGRRELRPALSLGLASCPEDARSSEFLLSEAERALRKAREDREHAVVDIETETRRMEASTPTDYGGYVFRSEKMTEILETVERIARSDISILLRGETGVGKEVIAEIIHRRSHRRDQPLVTVNCAALPDNAARIGAVRPREGRLHRRPDRQRIGPLRGRLDGGSDLPRRGRRDQPRLRR
jgi:diguanylate cyclase (GGDEF)-like protein